jgi:hypothetical protein
MTAVYPSQKHLEKNPVSSAIFASVSALLSCSGEIEPALPEPRLYHQQHAINVNVRGTPPNAIAFDAFKNPDLTSA